MSRDSQRDSLAYEETLETLESVRDYMDIRCWLEKPLQEEEQVFIASAKGRCGPNGPYGLHPMS